MTDKKIKIHVKNNHWAPGSFPTDAEGEENRREKRNQNDDPSAPSWISRSFLRFSSGLRSNRVTLRSLQRQRFINEKI